MDLELRVVTSDGISTELRRQIIALCDAAYGEDLAELFGTFGEATHVLGLWGDQLVSHAMWVTRWLQVGQGDLLRTAYVEMVATLEEFERRGFASQVMRRLVKEIPQTFDLAALCPAEPTLYLRLGWQLWRGPLHIRRESGIDERTPDESVMVFELAGRPKLDLLAPLSAEWREGELW